MREGVASEYAIAVEWEGGMRFRGGPEGGPTLVLDGDRQAAPSPVDSMLVALASCSAIDVVEILNKRRTPPESVRVRVEFSRAAVPPRRLTRVRLLFSIRAPTERGHVERAIALSFEKYCSVATSLAPDIDTGWALELNAGEPERAG